MQAVEQEAAGGLPSDGVREPQLYVLPSQLIEQWLRVPHEETVDIRLTRRDIDTLLFGLTKSFQTHDLLAKVIVDWSNGRVSDANATLSEAKRASIEGQNDIRQFIAAAMISALGNRSHGA